MGTTMQGLFQTLDASEPHNFQKENANLQAAEDAIVQTRNTASQQATNAASAVQQLMDARDGIAIANGIPFYWCPDTIDIQVKNMKGEPYLPGGQLLVAFRPSMTGYHVTSARVNGTSWYDLSPPNGTAWENKTYFYIIWNGGATPLIY